jgi:RNA polymerase sigma-70 factor (ECF subfamily)
MRPHDSGDVTPAIAAALFEKAGAARWLTPEEFAEALRRSLSHARQRGAIDRSGTDRYLSSLHVSDLALATACALGKDPAWDHFVLEWRPVLYRAADALDRAGGARDLADSLYADLFGTREGETRGSLLLYFHGRSSLATWLRAVLSQRFVDRVRASRRTEPLPDEEIRPASPSPAVTVDPDRTRLVPLVERALRTAIEALPVRDRLRLRSYHVAGMTLAQIGRLMHEHEATVSRHLARLRKELRAAVERQLERVPLTRAEIDRGFELAVEDPGSLDLQRVFEPSTDRKNSPPERSK